MSPPKAETTYSNIGFDLLGTVLSNVTGTDFREYVESAILQPLGMNNTSFSPPEQSAAKLPFQAPGVRRLGSMQGKILPLLSYEFVADSKQSWWAIQHVQ